MATRCAGDDEEFVDDGRKNQRFFLPLMQRPLGMAPSVSGIKAHSTEWQVGASTVKSELGHFSPFGLEGGLGAELPAVTWC